VAANPTQAELREEIKLAKSMQSPAGARLLKKIIAAHEAKKPPSTPVVHHEPDRRPTLEAVLYRIDAEDDDDMEADSPAFAALLEKHFADGYV
jgi:hypothetical protein